MNHNPYGIASRNAPCSVRHPTPDTLQFRKTLTPHRREFASLCRTRVLAFLSEPRQKYLGIFERGTTSAKYEGSGIGLAIVARAIQRMGGTYGVESKPGVGSPSGSEFRKLRFG